jgi:ribosomal protein S18 acetylase RimI-like enzyme
MTGTGRRDASSQPAGDAQAIDVTVATEVTVELVQALARLVGQLSRSAPPPTEAELAEIVLAPATHLLVSRDAGGTITGTLTLVLFRIPTGVRAWIEDVVVDESARGLGTGESLTRAAIDIAVAAGARTVDLTSRPDREAANRLYRRLGFEQRATNVYRWCQPG